MITYKIYVFIFILKIVKKVKCGTTEKHLQQIFNVCLHTFCVCVDFVKAFHLRLYSFCLLLFVQNA